MLHKTLKSLQKVHLSHTMKFKKTSTFMTLHVKIRIQH